MRKVMLAVENEVISVEIVRDDLETEEMKELDLEKGTDVKQLLEDQGIERQEVLVSKNGTIVTDNHKIEDGDSLKIMDVIAGG
jgi:sulfur carrier protein ThiS